MTFAKFEKQVEDQVNSEIDMIPQHARANIESSLGKFAHDRKATEAFISSFCEDHDISRQGYDMVTKIAGEIASCSMRSRIGPVDDIDYLKMMKSAGVVVNPDDGRSIEGFVEGYMSKIAAGEQLSPAELLFDMTPMAQQSKVANNQYPNFGRFGRYFTAALPVAALGSYVAGRYKGYDKGQQELADALYENARAKQNQSQ